MTIAHCGLNTRQPVLDYGNQVHISYLISCILNTVLHLRCFRRYYIGRSMYNFYVLNKLLIGQHQLIGLRALY
jgi:hypothetical protein